MNRPVEACATRARAAPAGRSIAAYMARSARVSDNPLYALRDALIVGFPPAPDAYASVQNENALESSGIPSTKVWKRYPVAFSKAYN